MPSRFTLRLSLVLLATFVSIGCRGGTDVLSSPHQVIAPARYVANSVHPITPAPRELQKMPLPAVFVQPGDTLLIEPSRIDDAPRFSPDQTVMPDGTIDLGIYGRPVVAGLTTEQVEGLVRQAICRIDPQACRPPGDLPDDREESQRLIYEASQGPVNVRIIGADSVVFYALGEVASPGAYPLQGYETVLDAILKAGGLTEEANRCEIILSRPTGPRECRVVVQVCYDRLVQLGDATTNYQVMPGDRIFVASKTLCESICETLTFGHRRTCEHCCDTGSCPSRTALSPYTQSSPFTGTEVHPSLLASPVNNMPLDLPDNAAGDFTPQTNSTPVGPTPAESIDEPTRPNLSIPSPTDPPEFEIPEVNLE